MGFTKSVLVVEDNAYTSRIMKMLLEAAGYGVVCTADGQEALDSLDGDEQPCAILLDLSMPILDGWKFRQRQLQVPALASIPVILISAEANLAEHAAALGAVGYFPKPVDWERLLKLVSFLSTALHNKGS
jgi:two-component system chemotaxis response regulator CheY